MQQGLVAALKRNSLLPPTNNSWFGSGDRLPRSYSILGNFRIADDTLTMVKHHSHGFHAAIPATGTIGPVMLTTFVTALCISSLEIGGDPWATSTTSSSSEIKLQLLHLHAYRRSIVGQIRIGCVSHGCRICCDRRPRRSRHLHGEPHRP